MFSSYYKIVIHHQYHHTRQHQRLDPDLNTLFVDIVDTIKISTPWTSSSSTICPALYKSQPDTLSEVKVVDPL